MGTLPQGILKRLEDLAKEGDSPVDLSLQVRLLSQNADTVFDRFHVTKGDHPRGLSIPQ